ncbi:hypothetical protein GIB67_026486 [Kingdonia uniflora]|uniref:Uncharacterized protein n=1 Tax=Kingdonia uniflora TaxID=39325 RepID=A0A7J7P735_9MAGN|nr:hypothetical protein GIB67_026486 [Kingdonia uniflora]
MLEQISMSTLGDSTLPLENTLLLGQYQFPTPVKTEKHKRKGGNGKEYGKRKKAEPRTKKGKGEWQKKAEEAYVPNKKKKVEGSKKKTLTDEQFDHVPLIHLKALIPKIPNKGLANRVPRKRRVANDLMVDDDVKAGREVNFNAISSEYGGDLLEWKKGDEKDNADKKDVEEKVKSEEEEMEESKNGDKKVDDVTEEEDSGQPTLVASDDQTTVVSVEEQTLEVEKTEDEASQASAG